MRWEKGEASGEEIIRQRREEKDKVEEIGKEMGEDMGEDMGMA